jgi:hypothetical protein
MTYAHSLFQQQLLDNAEHNMFDDQAVRCNASAGKGTPFVVAIDGPAASVSSSSRNRRQDCQQNSNTSVRSMRSSSGRAAYPQQAMHMLP